MIRNFDPASTVSESMGGVNHEQYWELIELTIVTRSTKLIGRVREGGREGRIRGLMTINQRYLHWFGCDSLSVKYIQP